MGDRFDRREFLGLAAGAGILFLDFLYPAVTKAAGRLGALTKDSDVAVAASIQVMDGPDPTYAGGEVVEKTSEGIVLKSAEGVRAVRIPPDISVWKEFDVKPDVIQLGDWVDVKGTPLSDGTLLALSGWVFVNIGRREGVVEQVTSDGLVLKGRRGAQAIEVSPALEVVSLPKGVAIAGGILGLRPGQVVGAVGLRLANEGFRATKIWFNEAEPSNSEA